MVLPAAPAPPSAPGPPPPRLGEMTTGCEVLRARMYCFCPPRPLVGVDGMVKMFCREPCRDLASASTGESGAARLTSDLVVPIVAAAASFSLPASDVPPTLDPPLDLLLRSLLGASGRWKRSQLLGGLILSPPPPLAASATVARTREIPPPPAVAATEPSEDVWESVLFLTGICDGASTDVEDDDEADPEATKSPNVEPGKSSDPRCSPEGTRHLTVLCLLPSSEDDDDESEADRIRSETRRRCVWRTGGAEGGGGAPAMDDIEEAGVGGSESTTDSELGVVG